IPCCHADGDPAVPVEGVVLAAHDLLPAQNVEPFGIGDDGKRGGKKLGLGCFGVLVSSKVLDRKVFEFRGYREVAWILATIIGSALLWEIKFLAGLWCDVLEGCERNIEIDFIVELIDGGDDLAHARR